MKKSILMVVLSLYCFEGIYSQHSEKIVIGTKHIIHSNFLNEDREYWISLPESYNEKESTYKRYPILIVLDGNVHFKPIASMVQYMSADAYRSWQVPEMIVVGVQNVDRRRDYTPDKIITVRENNSGGGDKFLSFLENELIPELDQNYRTIPYRTLYGHSLGGLLATHAYMKEKTIFNSSIAVDPSFGTWDTNTMDQKLDALTDESFKRYLYIATANWGKRNLNNRDRHVRLFEALKGKCKGEIGAKLEYFENESHSSVPILAFYNGIMSQYEGYSISYREVENKEQLVQHFESISQRLSWEIRPPEHLTNQLGYRFIQSKNENDRSKGLDFFILNVENYPNSFNANDSLGEGYEMLGDNKNAIKYYKKSLQLNPDNEYAKLKIEQLSGIKK